MADQIPLRIVTVSGEPFIGEFQSGDTVGVVHGGTGVSSIAGLKDALDYTITGLDDVAVGFPDALSANQILVWNGTAWINEYNDKTEMRVRNGTASAMSKGDVIAIQDAHNQNLVNVILADASQTSAMPALGILEQDLAAGEEGIAITFGKVQGVVTTGFTEGATAYVSPTTPGGIVDSRPTADNHLVQNIGIVMRAHPSNGAIKVTGIGRANDIPNDVSSNIASNTSAIENSAQLSDVSVELSSLVSSIHHGELSGLGDNDHPQYVLSSTNSALSSLATETLQYVNTKTHLPQINSSYSGLTAWTEGTGAMTDWDIHPSMEASSNVREFAPDPFNGSSIVWKAFDDGPHDTQAWEGGFFPTGSAQALDTSKPHRFSVFIKQHDNIIGSLYMGPHTTGSSAWAVVNQVTGSHNTNPYFEAGDNPEVDEWYLWVGFINASGTTTGSKNYDDLAGMYAMDGTRTNNGFDEYTFSSTATNQSLRAFYYSDSANDAQIGASFWAPRIDALDGNEPTIQDLLRLINTNKSSVIDALAAFSYMQMTSDGTAGTTELNIGRGATQTVVEDGSTNIVWDSANNEFDVSATGTYHVLANLVLSVAATATIDLKIKKNTTAQNTFAAHGVHSAEDPEEVTMQCVFDATAGDTISVTFDELGSNNVTPKSGTNIMVRRLA